MCIIILYVLLNYICIIIGMYYIYIYIYIYALFIYFKLSCNKHADVSGTQVMSLVVYLGFDLC